MSQDTIRIGVIGAGGNTRGRHLPGLQAIAGVEIASVCNRHVESAAKVAAEFGIPKVYEHWHQVIDDPEIDAVLIGTWPYLHAPVACAALENGLHVMVEARMAMNASEAHDMLTTSRLYPELIAQVVPSPFTLAFDATIQALIADGFLGDILAIDVRGISPGFLDTSTPLSWRQDADLSGLNTLAMGIYYEALARWVGHARRVTAMRRVFGRQRPVAGEARLAAVRVPDHVDILAEMDCGAQAHFRFSAVMGQAPQPADFWLYGSAGTLHLDLTAQKLYGASRGDQSLRELPIAPERRGGWRVEAEFIGAIRGEEPIRLTTFSEGVKYMEFTEAVARAADSGQAVSLPLLS